MLACAAEPLAAQPQSAAAAAPHCQAPAPDQIVDFSADQVVLRQRCRRRDRDWRGPDERATAIISPLTRSSGTARPARSAPQGNVVVLTPQGDKLVGDDVVLTDTLRDGAVDNLLVVLESGGRIAAQRGTRAGASHDPRECDLLALPGYDRRPAARSGRAGRSPRHG